MYSEFRYNLSTSGLKSTKARLAVLEVLEKEKRPLDVSEIAAFFKKKKIHTDLVTIYRILDIFLKKELVQRFEFQEGKFRYELVGKEHHHLICENCGDIEDISECNIGELENDIMRKKGFSIKRHALEFFGTCSFCLEK